MRYLCLFSGIGAATQAWSKLGWECVGFSEIEPFPCAVLEHHYPNIPNLGDVTQITEQKIKELGQIDLVVFGSPCQNLSVAGNRTGLAGKQSNLFYAAMEVIGYAKEFSGCRFALWENVPGAFSSNKGADFGSVVSEMAGLGRLDTPKYGWGKEGAALGVHGLLEWSVLDAQWFGLAQRRKRIFALLDFGDWQSRPPILLERKSLRGDTPPSREAGENVAANATHSFNEAGFAGYSRDSAARDYKDASDLVVEHRGELTSNESQNNRVYGCDGVSPTLASGMQSGNVTPIICIGGQYPNASINTDGSSPTLTSATGVVELVKCLNPEQPQCWRVYDPDGKAPTLQAGEGRGNAVLIKANKVVAIAGNIIGRTEGNGGNGNGFDDSGARYTLTTNDRHAVVYSFDSLSSNSMKSNNPVSGCRKVNLAKCLDTTNQCPSKNQGGIAILNNSTVVRRLTPIECERLQGFPDDFTKIPYRGKPADDCPIGARYKALGNSMAVPVMAWIGEQVAKSLTHR